jgi:peptidoglycan/xylan/chitin deacetylase (PgdA/CDA1 family)
MKPLIVSLLAASLIAPAAAPAFANPGVLPAAKLGARLSSRTAGPVEVHQRLSLPADSKAVALTLDACGGGYDAELINFLIAERIPATIFATRKWLDRNPEAIAVLRARADLFTIEDHGANHVPPVIGAGRRVYGIPGNADLAALENEVQGGARAITASTGTTPRWYRGATAMYDAQAIEAINRMGYKVAGFSVNADAGATLKREAIVARLKNVQPGDIIIAHMNKPAGDTAEGLAVGLRELKARGLRFVTLSGMEVRPAT